LTAGAGACAAAIEPTASTQDTNAVTKGLDMICFLGA
jgi:hypothetical protein